MKITFNIECTPDEARQFLNLPNFAPLQEKILKAVETKMQENLLNLVPDGLLNNFLSATVQNLGEMQRIFSGTTKTSSEQKNRPERK